VAGRDAVNILTRSVRFRNDKIKARLGWSPKYTTYREGIPGVVKRYLGG